MALFERVIGRQTAPLDEVWLKRQAETADIVLLDVGTGDGRFILDEARSHPGYLCIGIDPVAENMQRVSRLAAGKPGKGGAANALFLRGATEQLPGPLVNIADKLTVNYPWGSLLHIVAVAQPDGLRRLRAACREGAEISILLNRSVFDNPDYAHRLGLPPAEFLESQEFIDAYRAADISVLARQTYVGDPPIRTMWGRHLVRGSGRSSFVIDAVTESRTTTARDREAVNASK